MVSESLFIRPRSLVRRQPCHLQPATVIRGYKSSFDKSNNLADPPAYAELASQASIGCISGDLSRLPSSTFTGERRRESYHGTTSERSEPFACNTPDESIEVSRAHGSGPIHNEHCGNKINPRGIHRTLP